MTRCFITYALFACSVLASGPAIGQDPSGGSDSPPSAEIPVLADPSGGSDLEPAAGLTPASNPLGGPDATLPTAAVPRIADPANAEIKVFKLAHISAKDAEKLITQLFAPHQLTLAADERSNQLFVRDDNPEMLKQVEAILLKLDEPAKGQPEGMMGNSASSFNPLGVTGPGPGVRSSASGSMAGMMSGTSSAGGRGGRYQSEAMGYMRMFSGMSSRQLIGVEQAKSEYRVAEERAAQLAVQVQQQSKSNPKDPQLSNLRKQLEDMVADAFAKRQQLHRVELAELEQRVQKVQASLEAREKIRKQIIDRRVEELLNPNVNWDSATGSDPKPMDPTASAAAPGTVQGVIILASPDKKMVEISLGQADGLTQGQSLLVFTGNQYLGRIEVVVIEPDRSVARIVEEQPDLPMLRGHRVVTLSMRLGDVIKAQSPLEKRTQDSGIGQPGPARLPSSSDSFGEETPSSLGPASDGSEPMSIQLKIDAPKGATLLWSEGPKAPIANHVLPHRISGETGQRVLFQIRNIPGREGLELRPSIELANNNKSIAEFLKHNAIPVKFTDEDMDQIAAGNLVTKVIFLPHPKARELGLEEVQALVSTKLDPGVDPVAEARRRGRILAVVRLVNLIPKARLSYDPLQELSEPLRQSQKEELTREQLQWSISKQQTEMDKIPKQLAAKELSPNERNRLKSEQVEARLGILSFKVQLARTYPIGSEDRTKQLQSAAEAYEELYQEHRSQFAGVHARYIEARCRFESGEKDEAEGIFKELLSLPDEGKQILDMKSQIRRMLAEEKQAVSRKLQGPGSDSKNLSHKGCWFVCHGSVSRANWRTPPFIARLTEPWHTLPEAYGTVS